MQWIISSRVARFHIDDIDLTYLNVLQKLYLQRRPNVYFWHTFFCEFGNPVFGWFWESRPARLSSRTPRGPLSLSTGDTEGYLPKTGGGGVVAAGIREKPRRGISPARPTRKAIHFGCSVRKRRSRWVRGTRNRVNRPKKSKMHFQCMSRCRQDGAESEVIDTKEVYEKVPNLATLHAARSTTL